MRHLRYFQAPVAHGSFSRAARSVHISRPALSIQISELETTPRGPPVERESRGIALTRLGRMPDGTMQPAEVARAVQRSAGSLATLSRLAANGAGPTLLPGTPAAAERAGSPDLRLLRFAPPETPTRADTLDAAA